MFRNLPKEVRVHVHMTAPMYEALRKENLDTGCPLTEIVRRAVQVHLDEKAPAQPVARPVVFVPSRETR